MITVSATTFKAKCLALIEEMNRTNVPIVVTNHGTPVAEMYPARAETAASEAFIGLMKGTVVHYDDPFGPAENWFGQEMGCPASHPQSLTVRRIP